MSSVTKVNQTDSMKIAEQMIRSLGVNLSTSDEAALVTKLSDRLYYDPERNEGFLADEHGQPAFDVDANGIVCELNLKDSIAREVGRVVQSSPTAPSKPGAPPKRPSLTEKMVADLALGRGEEAKKAAAAEAARGPNPWLPQHQNISRQGLITNFNPGLAQQLKLAA